MKRIKTKDGSLTCYSEKFAESYHSVSGAVQEAFEKYVVPCKIADGFKILDICFGIGYNTAACMENFKGLKVVGLEFDRKIVKEILKLDAEFKHWDKIKKLGKNLKYKDKDYDLKILIGDARKTILKLRTKFDAVFLDPFSTMKNPELWTVEFFSAIKDRMKPDAILSTYSSAALVRNGLVEAGFKVGNGPCIGRYRPCTLASINEVPGKSLTEEDLKFMRAFGKPFRDLKNWSKEKIIKYRDRLKDYE